MKIGRIQSSSTRIKLYVEKDSKDMPSVCLYIIGGDSEMPLGLLDDLQFDESVNKEELESLKQAVINEAIRRSCYTLKANVDQGDLELHRKYKKLGLKDYDGILRLDQKDYKPTSP